MVKPRRFEVYLAALDPTQGAEIRKTRPCVIISPNEANDNLDTVIIAPMSTVVRNYPFRVRVRFQERDGQVALDQLRAIDKLRLRRRLGVLPLETASRITAMLLAFFG